ncbi:MAG: DNA protecting protein DprA [Elusimicrobia bacterium RIFOXYB2_FULL_62_6]|nr:MAG: DNA protecting protein DprA [Elusimicrobia bacterium RIFOXYB2_FULL_62_6]
MPIKTEEEKLARIRLNFTSCMRSDWILKLMELYGGAGALLQRGAGEIAADGGISFETAERFTREMRGADPLGELEAARKAGVRILTEQEEGYPELLRKIPDPPLAIYVRGELPPEIPAVAVVGTRKFTDYGARSATRFARELARAGLAVVSGLARGVDTAAHEAAVKAGGKTWAVLGTGLNVCYPPENRKLAEKIVSSGGALVSEFPMDSGPRPTNFPRRNRVISGLSYAVLVVEGDYSSGALITARAALEQGREVLALPGPVDSAMSRGPNMLLKNGAALAESALDIIAALPAEALFGLKTSGLAEKGDKPEARLKGLSPDAVAAYRAIRESREGQGVDGLAEKLGWPVQRIAAALFELEAASLITPCADKYKPAL